MSKIAITSLTKVFPGDVHAVDDVSLTVDSGEFMVLVGPSGCGKTTLMRMVAGLEEVTAGSVEIGERDVTRLPARERDVAMVFQNYALYPHMTVRDNLGYGLKVRKTRKEEIIRRVDHVAGLLRLEGLLERRPGALSGGQRQRVAMGRAIVREPALFLMDEPLSNLDAKLRIGMRAELARLHDRLGVTTIYVTHDQVEAMTLGQRVAVLRDGRIQQVDTPTTLYRNPVNLFVAAFMGSPSMNLVQATVEDGQVAFAGFRIPLAPDTRVGGAGTVVLGIRPQDFQHEAFSERGLPTIEVTASVLELLGSEVQIIFPIDAAPVRVDDVLAFEEDDTKLLADDRSSFTACVDSRAVVRPGERVRLTVDPARFHFFDPESGRSLTPRRP